MKILGVSRVVSKQYFLDSARRIIYMRRTRVIADLWTLLFAKRMVGSDNASMVRRRKRSSSKSKSHQPRIDRKAVRNWTAYTVKLSDGTYYNGITAFKNVGRRIGQHGGRKGAKWARGKKVVSVVETKPLGRMSRRQAEEIENQITLNNRKRFGYKRVRGGYNAQLKSSLIPNYAPGSKESIVFILTSLAVAIILIWIITLFG
jgi:predicted GIY-YIG superfamily endonuclease